MIAPLRIPEKTVDPMLLLGRLLLAWIFLHEGFALAANHAAALAAIAKLGVSAPLAIASIVLQLVAGAALALGLQARLAALALALFCLATATLFHTNLASRNELLHFEKDLAVAGGMFVLAVCGAGAWSFDGLFARARFRSGAFSLQT
jgi:putative oxidoreductase